MVAKLLQPQQGNEANTSFPYNALVIPWEQNITIGIKRFNGEDDMGRGHCDYYILKLTTNVNGNLSDSKTF